MDADTQYDSKSYRVLTLEVGNFNQTFNKQAACHHHLKSRCAIECLECFKRKIACFLKCLQLKVFNWSENMCIQLDGKDMSCHQCTSNKELVGFSSNTSGLVHPHVSRFIFNLQKCSVICQVYAGRVWRGFSISIQFVCFFHWLKSKWTLYHITNTVPEVRIWKLVRSPYWQCQTSPNPQLRFLHNSIEFYSYREQNFFFSTFAFVPGFVPFLL